MQQCCTEGNKGRARQRSAWKVQRAGLDAVSNVLIDPGGKTWLVDWVQPVRGAAWIDVADLIPHLILAVHTLPRPKHALLAVPAWASTPPATLTSYAAAFADYWVRSSHLPNPPGVPGLRAYQARAGQTAIAWTVHRIGWT